MPLKKTTNTSWLDWDGTSPDVDEFLNDAVADWFVQTYNKRNFMPQ